MVKDRPADRAHAAFISLRAAIVEAALPPGTKLPEDVIATHYGVSRTLVRSTLAQLTSAGLVETGKAKSATVANPSVDDAKATFEVRRCLEREAVILTSQRVDQAGIERLRAHVAREETAADEGDTRVSGRLGAEFHLLISDLAGNPLLERYLGEVIWRCALILAVHGKDHDQRGSIAEHAELVSLIEQRETERAATLVERHLAAVEARALPAPEASAKFDLADVLQRY